MPAAAHWGLLLLTLLIYYCSMQTLFDPFAESYETWFATPVGAYVKACELELVMQMLEPQPGELMLDAGCGTGVFSAEIAAGGAGLIGVDLSEVMLGYARRKGLDLAAADMLRLPFADASFDKVVSITALEFIQDGQQAVSELQRVLKPGGRLVLATLNGLSAWNRRRLRQARAGNHHIFTDAVFRTPADLRALLGPDIELASAVHHEPDNDLEVMKRAEVFGKEAGLLSGAFLIAKG